jgi:hypothetical protein
MKPFKKNPEIGTWYRHLDKGHEFQVVAFDPDEGLVEIQYFDGDLEEIDLDSWHGLDIEPIAEPESWSGPLDIGEMDDLGTEITDTEPEDWLEPETGVAGGEEAARPVDFGEIESEEEEEERGATGKPWED